VKNHVVVAGMSLVALFSSGCDWAQDRLRTCGHLTVELRVDRQNRFPAHIAIDGEDFSEASFLQPGQTRRITTCVEKGDRVFFRAEESGQVSHGANCVYSRNRQEAEYTTARVVLYPNQLACENW